MNSHPYRVANRNPATLFASLRNWLFATVVSFAFLGSSPEAFAQTTVSLQSARDSDLYNNTNGATVNYGACTYFTAGGKGAEIDRGIIGFDLTGLPANVTITSAVLRLRNYNGYATFETTNRSVAVHPVTQVWTEGSGGCYPQTSNKSDVSWSRRTSGTNWTTAGGTFGAAAATITVGGDGFYDWNITSQAQSWYANPAANNGLVVKYTDETITDKMKVFATKENATSANRPQLIITYNINCTGSTGGATSVCAGGTANVTPSTGGTWSSSNNAIATVTNGGVVTGIIGGTVTLTFTESGTGCQYTRNITVANSPVIGGGNLGVGSGTLNYEFINSAPAGNTVDNIPWTNSYGATQSLNVEYLQTLNSPGDANYYSIRFLGYIRIETAETYTFYTNSDDGTKLYINGTLVVNNDGAHTAQEVAGNITLTPGWYPFRLEYFQDVGDRTMQVLYSSPSIPKQLVPFAFSNTLPAANLTLCAGATANLTPSTGGTWSSSNSSIATVTNGGVVTGVGPGTATLTFTDSAAGCSSSTTVTVNSQPVISGAAGLATNTVNYEIYSGAPAGNTVDNIPTTGATSTGTISSLGFGTLNVPESYRYTGFLNITTAGNYTFSLLSKTNMGKIGVERVT